MVETEQTSDIYGILLDSLGPRVLMLINDRGDWSLPHVRVPDKRIFSPDVEMTCNRMRELLTADVTVLRNVYTGYSDNRLQVDLIYVLENHTPEWAPPVQGSWITRNELAHLALSHPEHQVVIEGVLQEAETKHVPPLRPPWACPGWFNRVSSWIYDQLKAQHDELTSSIEQIKTWGISCILRTQTNRGPLFFKVSSSLPLFGNEPALLKALSDRYPDMVPAPTAIEREERWMLMADFGPELRKMPTLGRWEAAANRFGRLQVQAIPSVAELLAVGCLDRRLDILSSQIDPLLADEAALAPLAPHEISQVRALAPRLKAMCQELAGFAVPYTLNHGDLHSGNISGQTLLFFDWTDACIAHPFLDLSTLIRDVEDGTPGARETVLNTYLSQWIAFEPMHRLRAMWQIAEPLGALHQAVSYQHILATLESTSRQEMIGGAPEWLRRMMQTIPGSQRES